MSMNYMGPSPSEENLRWELQQAKIRLEQVEARIADLENQLIEAKDTYDHLSSEQ
jgi:outer membrane protein TolC